MAVGLACVSALWSASALAETGGSGIASIPTEFWVGLFFTVLFSLLAGYAKGIDRRVSALEFDFRQQGTELSLIRERMSRDHPTKQETAEHRQHVEDELRYIRERLDAIANRRN